MRVKQTGLHNSKRQRSSQESNCNTSDSYSSSLITSFHFECRLLDFLFWLQTTGTWWFLFIFWIFLLFQKIMRRDRLFFFLFLSFLTLKGTFSSYNKVPGRALIHTTPNFTCSRLFSWRAVRWGWLWGLSPCLPAPSALWAKTDTLSETVAFHPVWFPLERRSYLAMLVRDSVTFLPV